MAATPFHPVNSSAQVSTVLLKPTAPTGGRDRSRCYAWSRSGKCSNGDSCRYSHDPQAISVDRHTSTLNPGFNRYHTPTIQRFSHPVQKNTCAFLINQKSRPSPDKPGGLPLLFTASNGPRFARAHRTVETSTMQPGVGIKREDPSQPISSLGPSQMGHVEPPPTQEPPIPPNTPQNFTQKSCHASKDGKYCQDQKCVYSYDSDVIFITSRETRKTPPVSGDNEVKNPGFKGADSGYGPVVPSQPPCYKWMMGTCGRSICHFAHDPENRGVWKKTEHIHHLSQEKKGDVIAMTLVNNMPPTNTMKRTGHDASSHNRENNTPQGRNKSRFVNPAAAAPPIRKVEICLNFLCGKCILGDRCPRLHRPISAQIVKPPEEEGSVSFPAKEMPKQSPHEHTASALCNNVMTVKKDSPVGFAQTTTQLSPVMSLASTTVLDGSSESPTPVDRPQVIPAVRRQQIPVTQKTIPCLPWKDGRCFRGDSCLYIHDPQVQEAELARKANIAKEEAAITVERLILGSTRVVFGAGTSIQQIITGFESCRVLVKNLPLDAVKSEVENLFLQPGFNPDLFRVVVLRKSADGIHQESSVIFDNVEDGKNAAVGLDNTEFRDETLKLEVTSSGEPGQMDECGGRQDGLTALNLNFKAPSVRALAIYPSIQIAKEKAEILDNDYCGGRQVRVTLNQQPPGRTLRHFIPNAVVINGLAMGVSSEEIHRFSDCFSLKLFPPKIFNVDGALKRLQAQMKATGDLKKANFEVLETPHYKGTVAICAHFETWGQAKRVFDSLVNKEWDYLAGGRLNLFLPYPFQYSLYIPIPQYEAQKAVFTALVVDHGNDDAAHIIATRLDRVYFLRVVGSEKKAVGSLKVRIEHLAAGERINYWDRFFLTVEGSRFLDCLHEKTRVFVCPDRRLSVLKAFGEPEAVEAARKEIKQQIDRLASMEFGINLKLQSIRFFVRKGVQILKEMVGEDNVQFDISSMPCRITVRGGEDARHALRRLVDESLSHPIRHLGSDPLNQCPLCFDDPVNPFPLACSHLYCNGCIQHLLTSAINGKQVPLCCIGDSNRCRIPIPIPVIQRFLPLTRFNQLLENAFRTYVDQNPQKFRYCPTPDCAQIYRVTEQPAFPQCPSCFAELCSHCHSESHEGLTCAEWTRHRDPEEQERLLRRWAQSNSSVKRCPECRIFIEKVDGCNHIKCLCGAHVCWICRKSFNDGIYEHLNEVHGGAFDLPVIS